MALLSVDNLSVSFVTRNGTNKAVDNVSFSVEERQSTAIIGESGSLHPLPRVSRQTRI